MDSRLDILAAEVETLRKRTRWLTAFAALSLTVPALAFMGCGRGGGTLRAEKIELVDAKGKTQGILFVGERGATLSLNDASGKPRIALEAAEERPTLELYDAKGTSLVSLSAEAEGASLAISDGAGKPRVTQGVFQGDAWVSVLDPTGKVLYRAPEE